MARSKHATTKAKSPKPSAVKPAWPANDRNINNADFLLPSQFFLPKNLLLEILGRVPCRYTHKDYLLTSRLLLKLEKQNEDDSQGLDNLNMNQDTPDNSKQSDTEVDAKRTQPRGKGKLGQQDGPRLKKFGSRICMRRCISLTTLTIKYNTIMRQLLDISDFFSVNPDLREDIALVRVIFCDFINRHLELRLPFPNEDLNERCSAVENAIKDMHIRICGDFARIRIQMRAPTLPDLLEDKVMELEKAVRKMPLYAWVNQLLISIPEAIDALQDMGFSYSGKASSRAPPRSKFQPDLHCRDVFVFNRLDADELDCHQIFKKHKLNFGDKLECMALYLLIQKCNPKSFISLVNLNSTSLAVHAESLFVAKHGKNSTKGRKIIRIILVGSPLKSIDDELNRLGESGATSISIYEDVAMAGKWPGTEQAMVYGCSSMTGVIDPLEYLMFSERSDTAMLYSVLEYNQNHVLDSQTPMFLRINLECLKHTLEMPGVQSVIFLAHSIRSAETSQLVQKSIDLANHRAQGTSSLEWNMVSPVKENFQKTDYISLTAQNDGIFASPSRECNGGFMTVIERQLSKFEGEAPPKEVAKKGTSGSTSTSNVNNKFRNSGRGPTKQQNRHNGTQPRHEAKRTGLRTAVKPVKMLDSKNVRKRLTSGRKDQRALHHASPTSNKGFASSTESVEGDLEVLELFSEGGEF